MIQQQHWINGRHYSLTLEAWLRRQDTQKADIMPIMAVLHLAPQQKRELVSVQRQHIGVESLCQTNNLALLAPGLHSEKSSLQCFQQSSVIETPKTDSYSWCFRT